MKTTFSTEVCDLKHKAIDERIEKFSYMIQRDLKEIKESVKSIDEKMEAHILEVSNRVKVVEDETAIVRWLSKNPKTFIFLLSILISILMTEGYNVVIRIFTGIIK